MNMKYYEDYRQLAFSLSKKSSASIIENEESLLSFTPYIENRCSAACRFCSERLTKNGTDSHCGDICADYENILTDTLSRLVDRKIFLSISGKEPTESPEQINFICRAVCFAKEHGMQLADAVMYSNLSGFCKYGNMLTADLRTLPLTRIEFSRHHYDEDINRSIMLFKKGEMIQKNSVLVNVVSDLAGSFPMRMVCVMQRSGVGSIDEIMRYLDFARSMGINDIVFRELAVFDSSVDSGETADYIINNRVEVYDILPQIGKKFRLRSIIRGYYYFSFIYEYEDMRVCFEMSDYEEMERQHSGSRVHKLIFYPDGRLCRSWNKKGLVEDRDGEIF